MSGVLPLVAFYCLLGEWADWWSPVICCMLWGLSCGLEFTTFVRHADLTAHVFTIGPVVGVLLASFFAILGENGKDLKIVWALVAPSLPVFGLMACYADHLVGDSQAVVTLTREAATVGSLGYRRISKQKSMLLIAAAETVNEMDPRERELGLVGGASFSSSS